jgi:hypothetical protein
VPAHLPRSAPAADSPYVLGLHRKGERARHLHEHAVLVRFRYSDTEGSRPRLRRTQALCKFFLQLPTDLFLSEQRL